MEENSNAKIKTSKAECLINPDAYGGVFNIGIFNKNEKIEETSILFDRQKKIVVMKTNQLIEIQIKYEDIIGFFKDEIINLKKIKKENSDHSNIGKSSNYFNLFSMKIIKNRL